MREVKYKKIGLDKFGPYTSPLELEIEEGKLIVICGKNGVGKTTIFDSIAFTLYGATSKERLRPKDMVNRKVKKNCHTFVEFNIDDINYRVDRYYLHTKYGNTVIMAKNGQQYKKGHQECIREIEHILGPKKVFMNSLYFGQKVKTFFTDLDDSERKDIFRKIMRLDDMIIYHKKASEMIQELSNQINQNDCEIRIHEGLLERHHEEIKLLIKEKEEFFDKLQNETNFHKSNLDQMNKQLDILNKKINELKKEYDPEMSCHLDEVISDYNLQLKELEINFKNIVEQTQSNMKNKKLELDNEANIEKSKETKKADNLINGLKDEYYLKKEEIQNGINNSEKGRIISNNIISNNNKDVERITKEKNKIIDNIFGQDISTCPMCNRELDVNTKSDLEKYINELEEELKSLYNDSQNQRTVIRTIDKNNILFNSALQNLENNLKNDISKINQEQSNIIQNIQQRLDNAINKLKEIGIKIIQEKTKDVKDKKEEIIKSLNETTIEKNKIDSGLTELSKIENESIKLEIQKNELEKLIDDLSKKEYNENRLKSCYSKCDELKNGLKIILDEKEKLVSKANILLFWKDAFSKSGIESMLIDESIPFMNEKVSEYLDILSDGRYILSFDTVKYLEGKKEFRDKIELNVLDNESLADSRNQLSGGQTRILDIAIILTLCDLQSHIQGIKFNLILFDEIFDALDDDNIIRTSKLLKLLTKDKSVYVIAHQHIDNIEADEELRI